VPIELHRRGHVAVRPTSDVRSIILPVSVPGSCSQHLAVTSSWNDYLFAIFLSNTRNGPIHHRINALAGARPRTYAASMAGSLITSLPTLVSNLLGRYFIGGLMAGSGKELAPPVFSRESRA